MTKPLLLLLLRRRIELRLPVAALALILIKVLTAPQITLITLNIIISDNILIEIQPRMSSILQKLQIVK
jgi:hypothetical protein